MIILAIPNGIFGIPNEYFIECFIIISNIEAFCWNAGQNNNNDNHRCPWIFFQGGGQKDPLEFRKKFSGGGPGGPGGQQGVYRILGSRGSF